MRFDIAIMDTDKTENSEYYFNFGNKNENIIAIKQWIIVLN